MQTKEKKEELSSFDSLYHGVLTRLFKSIGDKRADNSHYELLDALKSGFAIYSLKVERLYFRFANVRKQKRAT